MGSSRNKMLEQQEAESRRQYQMALAEAQKRSPLELEQERRSMQFLKDWEAPGRDVRALPGLSNYIQIGQEAQERALQQRMGTGALRLSGVGTEGYAAKLREQSQTEAAQNTANALERAVASRYAEATGSILPLAQLQQSRSMGVLGSTQSREQAYLNAPRETPFWQTLTMGAVQGAAGVLGGLGAGGFFNKQSDRRLKSEIEISEYGLKEILALKSVKYIIEGRKDIGFIAQEVEEVMPEFVGIVYDDILGVNYAQMVSVLTKAVQELHEELQEVKQKKEKGQIRKLLSSFLAWLSRKV